MKSQGVYFHRENLIYSLEHRRVDLVTITSPIGMDKEEEYIEGLFPDKQPRCYQFPNRKVVFISARVHPGETPGSHIMNGILNFLCSNDTRAEVLRKNFVFKLVPMINPDGVSRGHYRTDTNGKNLNRFYNNPSEIEHPSIFGIVQYLKFLTGPQFFCYYDLHAHAAKQGIFVYGNHFENFLHQVESCSFVRLFTVNCKNFDYDSSVFSEKEMKAKNKTDGMSKEGSGRVMAFKITGSPYCFTIEANYHKGKVVNSIPQIGIEDKFTNNSSEIYQNGPPHFTPDLLEDCGRATLISLLDVIDCNPISRLKASPFTNHFQIKQQIASKLCVQIPYRLYNHLRKLQNNKEAMKRYLLTGNIEEKKVKLKSQNIQLKQQPQPTQKVKTIQFNNFNQTQIQKQIQDKPKPRKKSAPQFSLVVKRKTLKPRQMAKTF